MLRFVSIVALSAVAGLGQATPVPSPQAIGTGVVAGQIVDGTTGKPVGGATVTLIAGAVVAPSPAATPAPVPAAARRGVAIANGEGRFVFRDVPAGGYSVTATLDGYAPGAYGRRRINGPGKTLTLAEGARVVDASIPIWRLASISGIVRDDRGEPAVGVYMWVMRRVVNAGRSELALAGGEATDDRGHYSVSGLMPGPYVVGIRSTTNTWPVALMDSYRAASTSGTTAGVTREWAETGVVRLQRTDLIFGDWVVGGSLATPALLPGPNDSLLMHPHLYYPSALVAADATVITVAPGDDRSGVDLTMPLVSGVRVSGTLMGPDGPAANYGIRLIPSGKPELAFDVPVAYSVTDPNGRWAMLGVTQGSYVIRAYRVPATGMMMRPVPPAAGDLPGGRVEMLTPPAGDRPSLFAEMPVTVGSGNMDGLSLTFQPGARLSGRIVFDGATPAPPAARLQQIALTLRPIVAGGPNIPDARADAEGRFTTNAYSPGRYVVFNVTSPGPEWSLSSIRIGGVEAIAQPFTIGTTDITDVVVTFTDKITTLSGSVQADAKGDADSTVLLFPADMQGWIASGMSPRRLGMATTSATGAYQLRVALPGDYIVVALPPEVTPEPDAAFLKRIAPSGVRVTLAAGESKTQPLTRSTVR